MSILKVRSKPTQKMVESVMLSVQFPKRLHSYLSLYALARGVTRANVVRHEIEQWYNQEVITNNEGELLREIIRKAQLHWNARTMLHPELSQEEFLDELERDLRRKGINDKHIEVILSKLNGT